MDTTCFLQDASGETLELFLGVVTSGGAARPETTIAGLRGLSPPLLVRFIEKVRQYDQSFGGKDMA